MDRPDVLLYQSLPDVSAGPPEALLCAIDKKLGHRLLAREFDLLLLTVLFRRP